MGNIKGNKQTMKCIKCGKKTSSWKNPKGLCRKCQKKRLKQKAIKTKHNVNQVGLDWITCKCSKLFSDTKSSSAKTKFIRHLRRYEEPFFVMLVSDNIKRTKEARKR